MQEKGKVIRRLQAGGIAVVTAITLVTVAPAVLDGSLGAILVAVIALALPIVAGCELTALRRAGHELERDTLRRWVLEAVLAVWWVTAIYESRLEHAVCP